MTSIDMEWTDTGAVIRSTLPINCPACGTLVGKADGEHRCGDMAVAPKKKAAKRKKAKPDYTVENMLREDRALRGDK